MKHSALRLLCLVTVCLLAISSALAYEKLERGDNNGDVLTMQKALRALGYSITCDGNFGSGTLETVKSFQRRYGLTPDGVAGDKTLTLLYSLASALPLQQPTIPPAPTVKPAVSGAATGGTTAYVTTTGGSLNLRISPKGGSQVLATIPNGAALTVTKQGATWSGVAYNGIAGYVMTSFLSFSAPATTAPTAAPATRPPVTPGAGTSGLTATIATTGGSLNLRAYPQDGARVLTTIPNGARITVTTRGTAWCGVLYNGISGYVMTKFLTFQQSVPTTPAPTLSPIITPTPAPTPVIQPGASGAIAYVTTTGGSLNFRAAPQSNARVIAAIPNGTLLSVTSQGATWCSVTYNGMAGYVMTSFLRFAAAPRPTAAPTLAPTQAPGISGTAAYVTTTGGSLNMRSEAKSGSQVLCTIPNQTLVTVTARGATWCAVFYQGRAGYVMSSFLTFPGDAPGGTSAPTAAPTTPPLPGGTSFSQAVVTTSGGSLNLRAEASSNAKVLLTLPNAAQVQVFSRGASWSAIQYQGTSGYVMTKYLTFLIAAPDATAAPSYEETDPSRFLRTLKKGMQGQDVAWVQGRLMELGYTPSSGGVYDDKTLAAVKAFQGQNGLSTDGLAGSQTFSMLKSSNARRADDAPLHYTTLRVDDEGEAVTSMQKALQALGYSVKVNGTYDEKTHNAVVAFQQRNGLVISGIADALTRQILHSSSALPSSTPVTELAADAGWMQAPAVSQIKLLHWQNEIKPTVRTGQTITVFDPNTSLSWQIKFYSLGRHADSEPASWRDTQIMNRSFGNTSWTIHPVYVLLPSGQWTMATMHNRPHLFGSITDNGFGGHLCIHFLRDMDEAQRNDPNYGVNNQKTLRSSWKALTGEEIN